MERLSDLLRKRDMINAKIKKIREEELEKKREKGRARAHQILQLRKQGKTLKEIGKVFGVTGPAIRNAILRYGETDPICIRWKEKMAREAKYQTWRESTMRRRVGNKKKAPRDHSRGATTEFGD
jgi:hypothetical protein